MRIAQKEKSMNKIKLLKAKMENKLALMMCRDEETSLFNDNDGMGTIEIVLIITVLIGLVIVFKKQINGVIDSVFSKITEGVEDASTIGR